MNAEGFRPGDRVFVACLLRDAEQRVTTEGVYPGLVGKNCDAQEVEVTVDFPQESAALKFPRKNVFRAAVEAEKRLLARRLAADREVLKQAIGGDVRFYPQPIRPLESAHVTTNPLRAGEPLIIFGAQGNAWGKADSPQKILQVAGSVWEDIASLFAVLFVLGLASDHTKKLIGKYIIVEMRSLYDCLRRLRKMNVHYRPLAAHLDTALDDLEKRFGYRTLRNKIGAHRDGELDILENMRHWRHITRMNLVTHLRVFEAHLSELRTLYPDEMRLYFKGLVPVPRMAGVEDGSTADPTYESFDPPWQSEAPRDEAREPQ